ncbi:MAG: hydroxyacylglutathione hydrolase [Candidatus Sumerlaeota bacterium]|nr:hydroxyacylglutathione hydrolase [Candidatus Sumerlaeota bacterium]
MLRIETLTVGDLQSNCHLVANTETKEAAIVDPGAEGPRILAALEQHGLKPVAIWLTHAHIDHIGAAAHVRRATKAPLWVHEREKEWLSDPVRNLAAWAGMPFENVEADGIWKGGETFEALGASWRVRHLPGHSPGHVALLCSKEHLGLTGDLLFQGSMGRVDLPEGDPFAMVASLQELMGEPDETRIYVGHGPSTTIGREKASNQVVQGFLELR